MARFDLPLDEQPNLTSVSTMFDGRVVVGSVENGLFVIHPNGVVDHFTEGVRGLSSNRVRDVFAENRAGGRVWVATDGGLSEYVAPSGMVAEPFCGDGLVAATEGCDDGVDGELVKRIVARTVATCGDGVLNELAGKFAMTAASR